MDIKELESFKLADAVKFHDKLNPALWTEKGELDPEVHDRLMDIARDFMAYLGLSSLKVEDITISGSNAAYSYTPHSDLDLHILVDHSKLPDDEVYKELFNAKKTIYNDTHDIKVHGVPVELYVQDSNQPHHSLGEYSILKKDWIKMPVKRRANFDQSATKAKYEKLGELLELAIKTRSLKRVDKVLDIIKRYRKAGLEKTGEFGPENLAFKALRKQGLIQKLWDLRNELRSEKLSLEDYDPNGPPPGPEFPPTMPSGTVKVDVSDVYDWYKLGQHISNMKGLGKHDFGQGPPSTILSFGDENTEHKYIQDLMKSGLTTTDIDPKGHEPMKGQKTDPRYNVDEDYKKVEGGWHHYGLGYGGRREGIQPLPRYNQFATMNRHKEGTASDIYHYMRFLSNKDFMQDVDITGEEIANALAKLGGTNPKTELQNFNKEHNLQLKSWNRLWDFVVKKRTDDHRSEMLRLESASGYIPSNKEKNDPRFKTALTVDVKPDSIMKNAKAFGNKVSRAGIPPKARTNGKF